MQKAADFRQKEVISIKTGQRIGYVTDVDIDMQNGAVNAVIIPGKGKLFGIFGGEADTIIPWSAIRCIGEDTILVDYEVMPPRRQAK